MYKYKEEKYKDFIKNIQEHFKISNEVLFHKRNTLKIVEFEGKKYAIKSFRVPNFINKIAYRYLRDSKAKRSYENTIKLESLGISTAKAIGYFEVDGAIFTKSFYVSEFIDFDFEIRAVLSDEDFEDRENILKKFASYSFLLHEKGVYHVDYSPGNIIVKKIKDNYSFFIVDVNRMQFLSLDDDLRMKSLSRLTQNQNDTDIILKEYAKISNKNLDTLKQKLIFYIKKEQNYLNNKEKIKKIKGKIK